MFKSKSWLANPAGCLKIFDTNIYLNFYLISSQQLSSHYKSSEGRTSRSGNPQNYILHNTKRFVISLNIVNLSASSFTATLGTSSTISQQLHKIKSTLYSFCPYVFNKFIFHYFKPQSLPYWILSY